MITAWYLGFLAGDRYMNTQDSEYRKWAQANPFPTTQKTQWSEWWNGFMSAIDEHA